MLDDFDYRGPGTFVATSAPAGPRFAAERGSPGAAGLTLDGTPLLHCARRQDMVGRWPVSAGLPSKGGGSAG
jgi:hypothetical protein